MIPMAMNTAAIGAGLTLVGAGIGMGVLWAAGLQSIARQPEMQAKLQLIMIIGVSFIEATALFALVICLMRG